MNKCLLPPEFALHPEELACMPTYMNDGNGMPRTSSRNTYSGVRLRVMLRRLLIVHSARYAEARHNKRCAAIKRKMLEKEIL